MWFLNIFKSKAKPKDFINVELVHTDSNGLRYYEFNDPLLMPTLRYLKLQKFVNIWNMGLSNTELNKLIEIAEQAIEDGVAKIASGKRINLLKIASALSEIKNRQTQIRYFELFADIMAVSFIRSDEVYEAFDKTIHLDKKQYIMDVAKKKEQFFLSTNTFKRLSGSAIISSGDFQRFLEISEEIEATNREKLAYLNGLK